MSEEQDSMAHQPGRKNIIEDSDDIPPKIFCLIIEDDPDTAFIFKRAMTKENYKVEHISHGGEAQTALETLCPDVVLLDLHLPVVSGEHLLHQIHNSEHLSKTQVILVTSDHTLARKMESDSDRVLLKPVNHIQLQSLVKQILQGQKD